LRKLKLGLMKISFLSFSYWLVRFHVIIQKK
jgi:hypothetical protein